MANQSPFIALSKYLPYIEGISIGTFVVGYLLKMMHYAVSNELIIISLSVLSVIYFLGAYVPRMSLKEEGQKPKKGFVALLGEAIVPKTLGIGLAATVNGILFTIMNWNGFREMLLIGSSALVVAIIVGWLVTMSNEQARESLKPLLLRAVVLVMIGFYLLNKYGISTPMN